MSERYRSRTTVPDLVAEMDNEGELADLLAAPEIERLINDLSATRWTGRPGYSIRTMVGMMLARSLLGIRKWTEVVEAVAADPEMQRVLGCEGDVPSEWACYRFAKKVREHQAALDSCFEDRRAARQEREEAARRQRELARQRTKERVRETLREGLTPFWHTPARPIPCLTEQEQRERDALIGQQAKDAKWSDRVSRPRHVYGLDDDIDGEDGWISGNTARAAEATDPAILLTGLTDYHLTEILGDVTIDDVGRMHAWQIGRLQDRLIEAGLHPPTVRTEERRRLRPPMPKRGDDRPSPKRGKKQGERRGRRAASDLHRASGKRFKRRDTDRKAQRRAKRGEATHVW